MLALLLLFILLLVLLSIPAVQTAVAKRVTKSLNESYGTDINIHRLGLNWNGEVSIKDVYIADHHKDTLIYSKELNVNILNFKELIGGNLYFGNLKLNEVKLYIKTYQGEDNDNLSIFSKKFAPEVSNPDAPPFVLQSSALLLSDADIKIIDENLENPQVLTLSGLTLKTNDFHILDSDVSADIKSLVFVYDDELEVKEMSSRFSYTDDGIVLKNLLLKTSEKTFIDADIALLTGEEGFSDFGNNTVFDAVFREARVSANDVNLFYDGFGKDQTIVFTTELRGTLNDFELRNLNLVNQETRINGNLHFANLTNPEKDYSITISRHSIHSNYYDLRRFMPEILGEVLPKELATLGKFHFVGNTKVSGQTLDLEATLTSALGYAETVLSMSDIDNVNTTTYKGTVTIRDFDIGKLVETKSVGKASAMLYVDGRGFSQETINTELRGAVSSVEFNDYRYTNITVSGLLKKPFFNGNLEIDDPNLRFTFEGLLDVSEEQSHYDFKADVAYADLNKINLVERDSISIFTGSVTMDMKGATIDDVEGTIKVTRSTYQNLIDDYFFDDVTIISRFEDEERTIEVISSDIATGEISGVFLIEDLPNLFQNSIASIYTNYIPRTVTTNQYVNFHFEIFNKIVEIFVPELRFGDNTTIRGSVSSDESEFKLNFRTQEIIAFDNYIKRIHLQIDNNNPLFNTYVEIDSIDAGMYQVSNFNLINVTMSDTLFIRSEFAGGKEKNDIFNLSLYHTINEYGKSVVGMKKSDIVFKDNKWFVNAENDTLSKISFDNNFKDILIDKFVLSHESEKIELEGMLSDSAYKDIQLHFKDVDVGKITPEIDSLKLRGIVNGDFNFLQKENLYYPESTVTIDGFSVNEIPFGDLVLDIAGNEDLSSYEVDITLKNMGFPLLTATGSIDVTETASTIDLDVHMKDLNLKAFSPLGGDILTDIRGFVSGSASVVGNLASPDINGKLNLTSAGMRIPLLNIDFNFDDGTSIVMDKNRLNIPITEITDTKYNTKANLEGFFQHTGFSDWRMNLDIDTRRFLVLDTEQDEESLYYGTAFINGAASIAGPVEELVIDVTATTDRNTTFKIPISDTHSIGDDSFIYFLSPQEKQARISGETLVIEELKGLTLNFDLEITRDAEVEIVVDVKNNSTLKGRGEGTLFIEINTLGTFNMWGDFQVYDAQYNFRYGGLIQKPFLVERGGNIAWTGRPERARLDLKAVYNTTANPSVLLDNPTGSAKIPVQAAIILQGDLSSPNFEWEINFPNVSSIVKSELDFKLEDRQQRELQVLYLVATGSFSGSEGFSRDQGTSTLVEGVSGLVNDIFADEDGKFNVALDYRQGTRTRELETADRVGVSLSTQISERILINGRVGVPVGGVSESVLAGDLEIQLLLNEDGTLRLHFFNREAQIQFIGENQGFEQGTGITYSVDFDTFKELTNRIFRGKIEIEEAEEPQEEIRLLNPFEEASADD